jgi:hypothetical protein
MSALPTIQRPSSATLKATQPTRTSVSHSLKRQVRTTGAHRWNLSFGWQPMPRATFMQFYAFLMALRGTTDTFTCTLAGHTAPQGSWVGTPVVNGAAQSGRSVSMRGFTASAANVAKAGDLIKFAGHTKVYMVTADASANGSGIATVAVEPALLASPADGEVITYSNVPFTVALAGDTFDMALSPGMLAPLSITAVEVF